jgi:dTDP-glucose pyrophosphorylase
MIIVSIAKNIAPSAREYEITDVNNKVRQGKLKVRVLDRGQLGWIPEHLNL